MYSNGYVGTGEDVQRIRRMEKQREEQKKKYEQMHKQTKDQADAAGLRQFGASTEEVGRRVWVRVGRVCVSWQAGVTVAPSSCSSATLTALLLPTSAYGHFFACPCGQDRNTRRGGASQRLRGELGVRRRARLLQGCGGAAFYQPKLMPEPITGRHAYPTCTSHVRAAPVLTPNASTRPGRSFHSFHRR